MGFSEDDRIRSKNRVINEACELLEDLRAFGYDNAYIKKYAEFAIQNTTCYIRNEVYSRLISLLKDVDNEKKPTST